jgi:YfiH family protein
MLPSEPRWLSQVHGTRVIEHGARSGNEPEADSIASFHPGEVCAVLTADCLPVFFCNQAGDRVAVAHAGWRGLAAGILQETVRFLGEAPDKLMAWLGPAIGPAVYEVGVELARSFPDEFPVGFTQHRDRFLLDLYSIARLKLQRAGVSRVFGGELCTFSDRKRFYSYRRDGVTGRMANLIWLTPRNRREHT